MMNSLAISAHIPSTFIVAIFTVKENIKTYSSSDVISRGMAVGKSKPSLATSVPTPMKNTRKTVPLHPPVKSESISESRSDAGAAVTVDDLKDGLEKLAGKL